MVLILLWIGLKLKHSYDYWNELGAYWVGNGSWIWSSATMELPWSWLKVQGWHICRLPRHWLHCHWACQSHICFSKTKGRWQLPFTSWQNNGGAYSFIRNWLHWKEKQMKFFSMILQVAISNEISNWTQNFVFFKDIIYDSWLWHWSLSHQLTCRYSHQLLQNSAQATLCGACWWINSYRMEMSVELEQNLMEIRARPICTKFDYTWNIMKLLFYILKQSCCLIIPWSH